jgi:hypothetical protein
MDPRWWWRHAPVGMTISPEATASISKRDLLFLRSHLIPPSFLPFQSLCSTLSIF